MGKTNENKPKKSDSFMNGLYREWNHIQWKDKMTVMKELGLVTATTVLLGILSVSVDTWTLALLQMLH